MRFTVFTILASACLFAGCNKLESGSRAGPKGQGRYAGIGTFAAGPLWAQIAEVKAPADAARATLADDEHIIVVIDSHSGEVRQCGDHSGVCVVMDPWAAAQARAPVRLNKHAADLAGEGDAAAEPSNAATNQPAAR